MPTEQEIMMIAEQAGFGGQQRRTLKMKILRLAKLLLEKARSNEPV
jgi:hypothetical protein